MIVMTCEEICSQTWLKFKIQNPNLRKWKFNCTRIKIKQNRFNCIKQEKKIKQKKIIVVSYHYNIFQLFLFIYIWQRQKDIIIQIL